MKYKIIVILFFILSENVTSGELIDPNTCNFYFSIQGAVSSLDLSDLGVSTKIITLSQSSFSAWPPIYSRGNANNKTKTELREESLQRVFNTPKKEIKKLLRRELIHRGVNLESDIIVVMDIESEMAPRMWHKHIHINGKKKTISLRFEEIVNAYRTRIEILRELMPRAKIAAYGFPIPSGADVSVASLSRQIDAMAVAASEFKLLDQVDYIVPALYPRFGVTDIAPNKKQLVDRIPLYSRAAILAAEGLRRSDGSSIAILPFISPVIFNSNNKTKHRNHLQSLEHIRTQVKTILDLEAPIDGLVIWAASDSSIKNATGSSFNTIKEWFQAAEIVPEVCFR